LPGLLGGNPVGVPNTDRVPLLRPTSWVQYFIYIF
jgi:hypothetical protein